MTRYSVQTEIYLTELGRWKPLKQYPFDRVTKIDPYISSYAALYHDGAFYLFGGDTKSNRYSQTIARLDTEANIWSKVECASFGRST